MYVTAVVQRTGGEMGKESRPEISKNMPSVERDGKIISFSQNSRGITWSSLKYSDRDGRSREGGGEKRREINFF